MAGQLVVRAGVVAACLLLCGCGSDEVVPAAAPETTEVASPRVSLPEAEAPRPAGTSSAPAMSSDSGPPRNPALQRPRDGSRLQACRDADCEVVVADGQTVRLAPGFGMSSVKVMVRDGAVSFTSRGDGMMATFGEHRPGGSDVSSINGVQFRVLAVRDDRAVIRISH